MRYRYVRRVRKTIRPDCWRGESKRTKTVKRKENTLNGPNQQRQSAHVWWWKAGAGGRRYAGWHTHSLAHATAVGARRKTASDDGVRRRRFFVHFPRKLWERGDTVTTAVEPRLSTAVTVRRTRVVDASAHTSHPAPCATTYVAGWPL